MGEDICSADGCRRLVYCRGMCQRHYDRWCRTRDRTCPTEGCTEQVVPTLDLCRKHYNEWKRTQPIPACSINGCGRPLIARGWCSMHWKVWRKHGDPLFAAPRKSAARCAAEGCNRVARTKDYCDKHYLRLLRHGDPNYERGLSPRCSIENCDRPARTQGWCSAHYTRWKRWGDPMGKRAMNGTWRTDADGYRRTCINGKDVTEHRLVMEQMLSRPLLKGETVHHINGQRADNRPQNLELWVKSQPAGQRVENLVAWAKEILTRYGTDFVQPRLL